MKAIGFHPSNVNRRPLFAVDGRKLGYVQYEPGGRELATDVNGRTIARIIKWKSAHVQWCAAHATCHMTVYPRMR